MLLEGSDIHQIKGRVLVPTSSYKALYMPGRGAAAYVATNELAPRWQIVSIAELRKRSGVDPYPALTEHVKAVAADLPLPGRHKRGGR